MIIENVKISSLKLDPENARAHPDRSVSALAASLEKFGQQKPIIVDQNNVVACGNGTLMAAKKLGWKTIQIHRTALTGAKLAAFKLADNQTALLSEWDEDGLEKALEMLRLEEIDTGFMQFDFEPPKPESVDLPSEKKPKADPKRTLVHCPNCRKEFEL